MKPPVFFISRAMGKNPPVNGGCPAPAPTAPWAAMGATRRPAPLRITVDKVCDQRLLEPQAGKIQPQQRAHRSTMQSRCLRPPSSLPGPFQPPHGGARDSSSLPLSGPGGTDGSLSYHLNPTTLAMLQQHNYIPSSRGIRAPPDSRSSPAETMDPHPPRFRKWSFPR